MIISKTPYRLSFFGGGTDYNSWFEENESIVLAAAIDYYCYISIRKLPPFFNYKYSIRYREREIVNSINQIKHPSVKQCFKAFLSERDNLEMLCPNCHSQTDTYAGRNTKRIKNIRVKKCEECGEPSSKYTKHGLCNSCYRKSTRVIERPDKETLLKEIILLGFVGTGEKYKVSDNAIRKWCKSYGLPTNKKGIITYRSVV